MHAKDGVSDSPRALNRGAHSPQEIQVARYSRKQAFDYFNKSQFGRALAHLFVTLRLIPEWREELHDIFYQALSGGCLQLQNEGRLEETIQLRKDSLLLYPEDGIILMDLGSIYFKSDDTEQALQYYHQAIQVCPSLLPASRAIQSIYNKQVERWHFRMLNDSGRNEAYNHAIAHRIQEGHSSVLDVGTGTGLLSLFAVGNGAEKLWACESNPFMFKIAQSVLAANKVAERVNLLNKHSNLITIPSDIYEKVSLLVTEVFDAGLLGEGVLPMLIHAWENLLLPPSSSSSSPQNGIVVPFSATVWAVPIQSIDIARRHRLLPAACSCYDSEKAILCGENETPFIKCGVTRLCKLCEAPLDENLCDIYNIDDGSIAYCSSEPYTTEDLKHVPFGYTMLSKPYKVLQINFNNIEDLKAHGLKKIREEVISVAIESPGSVDAIAAWFHLNMDNNGTVISTAPFKEEGLFEGSCWHQAIFPSAIPKKVGPGDVLNLHINTQEGVLKILQKEMTGPLLEVSPSVVSFLNNKSWIKALRITAVNLGKDFRCNPSCSKKVLDLNPFPIIGLEMLRESDPSWKLIAKAETRADEICIMTIAKKYSINEEQIEFVTDYSLLENVEGKFFDIICVNVVDSSGELAEGLPELLTLLHSRLSSVGIILPSTLSFEGQLVESERLIQESRVVSDDRTMHFKIGEFMNNFAVDYHLDVSYNAPDFKALSNSFEVFMFNLNSLEHDTICGQYKQELKICPTGTGTTTGVIYWMNLHLLPGTQSISTACYDSHCNQAVLFSSQFVKSGQEVSLACHYWDGLLDMKFVKVNT